MKKIKEIVSWISVAVIIMVMGTFCIYCGACAANFIKETFQIEGLWCLALSPIVLIVAFGIEIFFILGLKKFGDNEN